MTRKIKILFLLLTIGIFLLPSFNHVQAEGTVPGLGAGGCPANSTGAGGAGGTCTCATGYSPAVIGTGAATCLNSQQSEQNKSDNTSALDWGNLLRGAGKGLAEFLLMMGSWILSL